MNILTFDVEEWFHLLDNESTNTEAQWMLYDKRIEGNVGRVLDILDSTDTKATFFVIGWIAKTYPHVIRRIAQRYEVASHTMNHQLVWQQSPEAFRKDVEESVKLLEDITGKPVTKFRAPGYSIRETEGWAFEILHELGITLDSSVFPAPASHGGMPTYPGKGPAIIEYKGVEMKEMPITYHNFGSHHIVFSGGGYFRLCPYGLLKQWSAQSEKEGYLLSYIHPRDLDPNQPMVPGLNLFRKFKSYYGLKGAEKKLSRWLTDFKFTDLATAEQSVDWTQVPRIRLE